MTGEGWRVGGGGRGGERLRVVGRGEGGGVADGGGVLQVIDEG